LSFCFILSSHGSLRVTPTRLFGYKYTIIFPRQDTLKLLLTDIRYFFFKTDRSHVVLYNLQGKNIKRMKQVEERYISLLTDFGFDRLFEEAEIAKFTPQEMREYETSKMAYRDIKNSVDTAKREGIAEGMEKGMNQKALDIARNMLADGVDLNLIMKYSGLTQEQIEKLK
jgi:predicted transposase/invertase (TIGR01784 family)